MRPMHELHNSTLDQFRRARRSADLEQFMARLRGRSADLHCYNQVRRRLVPQNSRKIGLREIPLQAIVGSVGRCSDYTRGFMPLKDSDQMRWTRVMEAASAAMDLPPIRAYRVGQIYFVVDGHHRVSVARQRGLDHIAAMVIEVQTKAAQFAPPE